MADQGPTLDDDGVIISVLGVPAGNVPSDWWDVLSGDERSRAEAFRFQADCNSYVGAHALLRLRLGEFTGQPARDLRFSNDEYGKPALDDRDGAVAFSLSHTRGMVAIAISAGGAVGVDVEATDRRISDEAAIVSAYFTPDEAAAFERAPEGPARKSLFVHMWTRKEAVLKAAGRGLGLPLSEFSVAGDNDWTEIPFIRAEAPFGFALTSRSFGAYQVAIAVRLAGQARPSFLWREEAQDIFPRQGY